MCSCAFQVRDATNIKDHSFATINLTYATFKICVDMAGKENVEERKAIFASLKSALASRSYTMPTGLEQKANELLGDGAPGK